MGGALRQVALREEMAAVLPEMTVAAEEETNTVLMTGAVTGW